MATATVFVDDAVLGHLPAVCVKTGVGTDDTMTLTTGVGGHEGLGLAWVLLLFGPLGWIGLIVYAATRREETITVRLPYSEPAYAAFNRDRRAKRVAGVATLLLLAGAAGGVFTLTLPGRATAAALFVVAMGALASFVTNAIRVKRRLPRVTLDGSRRWVTVTGCSPESANAVLLRTAGQPVPGHRALTSRPRTPSARVGQ